MEKSSVVATLALMFLMAGLVVAPTHVGQTVGSTARSAGPAPSSLPGAAPITATHASPAPMTTTFPRTVLVETFTGMWCPHCPAESRALYDLDQKTNHNVLTIGELHVCAFAPGSGPCLDNYVPTDNTSTIRGAFYNVCGFPDVFFDGQHDACGASNSQAQMENQYQDEINNASAIPGNVSISQSSSIVAGNVTDHVVVNSGITGSYNAVTYVLQNFDKANISAGGGMHDIAWIVVATLADHPVALTDGATTEFNATGVLGSTWNQVNLSVITLVQQNSTRIVENANMAPVTTLTAAVESNLTTLVSGTTSTITVHVVNSSTGTALSGATVTLSSDSGGSFSPASGTTASDGSFSSTYTAPTVASPETATLTAQVSATGYTGDSGTVVVVLNPIVLSTTPTGLAITPGDQQVALNWTTPAAGGAGVTYQVLRSTTEAGTYSSIGMATTTGFVDSELSSGQVYWYKVNAHGPTGISADTTAVRATGVSAVPLGLPAGVGWWFSIGSSNFSSPTNATLPLYLPDGQFAYSFGPDSYAFIASDAGAPVLVSGAPFSVDASFTPRYALLQGTVSPVTATVTVDGALLSVGSDGSFQQQLEAGTYALNVTSPGYQSNLSSVTLTPGNTTTVDVPLVKTPHSSGNLAPSSGGLTGDQMIEIAAAVAVVGVAAVLGGMMVLYGKGKKPGSGGKGPRSPPRAPRSES